MFEICFKMICEEERICKEYRSNRRGNELIVNLGRWHIRFIIPFEVIIFTHIQFVLSVIKI